MKKVEREQIEPANGPLAGTPHSVPGAHLIRSRLGGTTFSPSDAEKANPSDLMLTKRELAKRLKLTLRTVENWQRRGVLPFLKVGKIVLFHWPDVVEHLKTNFRVCPKEITK